MKIVSRFAIVVLGTAPWALLAQPVSPAPKKEETVQMEAFTVTGTNIRRIDEEKTLPVTVLDNDELVARSAPTMADLFETITSGGIMDLNEGANLGADARGDNASINLRGVGSGNTLVLLNGRRLAPHPISQAEGGAPSLSVNSNQLPVSAASRIEVLRDGSSAVYGSDAAAGVVNTLIRTDYDGAQLRAGGGIPTNKGGSDWRFATTWGKRFNANRSSISVSLEHFRRDMLRTSDRAWSRDADLRDRAPAPWNGLQVRQLDGTLAARDNDFNNLSSASNYGNFVRGSFDATGTFVGARPANNTGTTTSTTSSPVAKMTTAGIFYFAPLGDGATGFRTTTPSTNVDSVEKDYFYNTNANMVHQPETGRTTFMGQFDHQLKPRLAVRGELFFYDSRSATRRDPVSVDGQDEFNIYVGADNPWNPFGSRFYHPTGAPNADGTRRLVGAPGDVLIAQGNGVRPREFHEREINVHSQAMRGVLEFRGKAWGDFEWRSGVGYGRATTRDEENFAVRDSRLRAALLRTDKTAFNPFGYTFKIDAANLIVVDQPYANPASVVDPLYDIFIREGRTELALFDAKVDGTLFRWRNIPFQTAFGTEFRFENYRDWRPPYAGMNPSDDPNPLVAKNDNDFVALSPNINLYSQRTVVSGFAEVFVPLVGKRNAMRFVQSLDFSGAVRTEHFSTAGTATKPKVAAGYRPVKAVMFRGSYNESFRAPNLVQTNTQPLQRNDASGDPYRYEVTNLGIDNSSARATLKVGNENLKPEEAKTWTTGVVVEVPFVKGLSVTFDYFRLKQSQVISNQGAGAVTLEDEELLDRAVQAQLAAGKRITDVDLGSGTSHYLGSPAVVRLPVTPTDAAFFNTFNASRPPSQQRAPAGRIVSVTEHYINIAGRDVAGWDASIQYRFPRTRLGLFSMRTDATYSLRYDTKASASSPVASLREENGRPLWRANGSVSWRQNRWSASWFTNYWGEFVDTSAATTPAIFEALGRPHYIRHYNNDGLDRYYWRVEPSIMHTVNVAYDFGRREGWLRNVSVRAGVSNVFDAEPPFADETRGAYTGTVNARGRVINLQASKRF
jgi:iron complex outermembrane recepter protein